MKTNKKRQLLEEMVMNQLKNSKVEPLQALSILEFISRLNDNQVDLIVHESIEKLEKILSKLLKTGKKGKNFNLNRKLEELGKNQDKWYPRRTVSHKLS